ncbi:MAG: NADH-quinone oxidoreductase subunit NuoF [Lentisphaerae bacterium]|nr:NADH-quinone oxidoreductase subunit NuoF [Lentisphaerota bacterium]MBT5606366.1 NADH-quinone oxidoreductase subunit NuoF [Lentisphaerota bacterium]MBT7056779.1 NADH-quinone oxidoreductase subunit NuoF [Lentisphaerota bacterium]MBT7840384.1 NADH-quinone oxidoreductase subunit NuoF [Lentisphaerota bacterium]
MSGSTTIMLCAGTSCTTNRCVAVREALEQELAQQGLQDSVEIVDTGCHGFCAHGPIMTVQPEGIFYQRLTASDVPRLVSEHLVKGQPVRDLMYTPPEGGPTIPKLSDIGFFGKQRLIALANRGLINPESIDEYIGRGGYDALATALTQLTPEDIVKEIKSSGLRGRGGAGFPTGLKWEFCKAAMGSPKYVICNADEGDPGAFMDRSIIESDPHAVLEGMAIGAHAIGASQGIVYLRDEYPLALQRVNIAIEQAREYGLIGENILGTGFSFDLTVNRGAGAFVCGEETSLINSLEGAMPEPRTRPPFPAQCGYNGKPTNINNVETWANIPHIIARGSAWFASIGTASSKGTKVFSIVGKLRNTGLIEVPMGTTLRDIVFDIGGGVMNGKAFKAIQTGGPSGGCLPAALLDTPVDYESLRKAGAIMGSGGLIVMDESTCMVEVARFFLSFTQGESCGKCPPCREGTRHMLNILTDITEGKGEPGDIELLEEMGAAIKETAVCGLGNTAPNPVLTTIRYFRDEYEAHINDRRCTACVCKALITYSITADMCTGCHACFKNCPTQAIVGQVKTPHEITQSKCVKCGMCKTICKFDAVRCE